MSSANPSSWHGIDKHILATLLYRFWTLLAGGITVLLIPLCLTSAQQGYYFTFASILALQIFFELGMSQVVVQIVAHEAAYLHLTSQGEYTGDGEHMARLSSLRAQLRRWYIPAALLFATIVSCAGLFFFRNSGLPWIQWSPTWLLLVATTAINLYYSWKMSMIEGFGLVRNIAQFRLRQSIAGYLLLWVGLVAGGGLWVVVAVPLTTAAANALWLRFGNAAAVFRINSTQPPNQPISWMRDILPFQWRIAVSWISGYFIFQLFTPLIFKQVGAVEAGRLGLAITVFNAIGTIGLSWVNAKAPSLSMMIARRESAVLLTQFKSVTIRSVLFTILVSCSLLLVTWGATQFNILLIHRIASLPVLACLAAVTSVNCVIFSAAVFMRAHREEPMLATSVVCGILTAAVAWLGSRYGVFEMMLGYAGVTIFVALPWTSWLLRGYLARHREPAR